MLHSPDNQSTHRKLAVSNLSTGETFEDEANVLISARGGLNIPAWPDIPGLQTKFKGKVMHSAEWDESWVLLLTVFRRRLTADDWNLTVHF